MSPGPTPARGGRAVRGRQTCLPARRPRAANMSPGLPARRARWPSCARPANMSPGSSGARSGRGGRRTCLRPDARARWPSREAGEHVSSPRARPSCATKPDDSRAWPSCEAGEHVSQPDARAISLLDVPALRGADRPDARARWPSCARSRRSDRRTCVRPAGPLHSKAPALAAPPMCVRKRHSWRVTPTNRPSRLLSEDTRSCGNATFADRTLRELKTVGLKPGPTETLLQEKEGTATCGSSTPIRQVRAGQGGASSTKKLSSRRGG